MERCRDVMTRNPVYCFPTDTAEKAAQLMKTKDVGPIPVIDKDGQESKLIGIVTDRDLALKIVADQRDAISTRVEDIMTRDPITCREDDSLEKALNVMASRQIRRVPIVDKKDHLVGIIAQADIATRFRGLKKTGEVVRDISS